ncbi:MAG: ribokinase, partial [Atopobiaceae bacterium]|nr:ribokinase [Atopobiaceae bacterium]
VAYIGKVGNDPWGDLGDKWMTDAGADTTYLYRTDEVSTGTGLILIGPDGRNTVIDGDSSSVKLTVEEVEAALDDMADSTYFVTGFEVPQHVSQEGAKYAKKLGMTVALNPSPLPEEPMGELDYVDYLFINEVEGRYIEGLAEDDPLDAESLARKVRDTYHVGNVVMTLGGDGACALTADGTFFTVDPVHVEKVVNTAGAGDGFMAATVYGLVRGKSLHDAMEWAAKYAALSVTIDGTIPAYRPLDEVEAFIASL